MDFQPATARRNLIGTHGCIGPRLRPDGMPIHDEFFDHYRGRLLIEIDV
jgi:hypothetical protein